MSAMSHADLDHKHNISCEVILVPGNGLKALDEKQKQTLQDFFDLRIRAFEAARNKAFDADEKKKAHNPYERAPEKEWDSGTTDNLPGSFFIVVKNGDKICGGLRIAAKIGTFSEAPILPFGEAIELTKSPEEKETIYMEMGSLCLDPELRDKALRKALLTALKTETTRTLKEEFSSDTPFVLFAETTKNRQGKKGSSYLVAEMFQEISSDLKSPQKPTRVTSFYTGYMHETIDVFALTNMEAGQFNLQHMPLQIKQEFLEKPGFKEAFQAEFYTGDAALLSTAMEEQFIASTPAVVSQEFPEVPSSQPSQQTQVGYADREKQKTAQQREQLEFVS